MKIHRQTTYTAEIDDQEFPVPFEFDENTAILEVNGNTTKLGILAHDDNAEDPFTFYDSEGIFTQFNNHYIHSAGRPDEEEWKRCIRSNPGIVFTISDVGRPRYVIDEGPFTAADTRGEDCKAYQALENATGYYICPDDATHQKEYADGVLKTYSAWAEGDVWGVAVWEFTREDEDSEWELNEDTRDECWGFYGYDYATEELKAAMKR